MLDVEQHAARFAESANGLAAHLREFAVGHRQDHGVINALPGFGDGGDAEFRPGRFGDRGSFP